MSDLKSIQQQLSALRGERDLNETTVRREQQLLIKLDKQIARLERQGDGENAQGMLEELKQQRNTVQSDLEGNRKS